MLLPGPSLAEVKEMQRQRQELERRAWFGDHDAQTQLDFEDRFNLIVGTLLFGWMPVVLVWKLLVWLGLLAA
jgi:hypothetical protein